MTDETRPLDVDDFCQRPIGEAIAAEKLGVVRVDLLSDRAGESVYALVVRGRRLADRDAECEETLLLRVHDMAYMMVGLQLAASLGGDQMKLGAHMAIAAARASAGIPGQGALVDPDDIAAMIRESRIDVPAQPAGGDP